MISNAACEPHVQDLCRFLMSLGAKIDGIGSNVLRITGVEGLSGGGLALAYPIERGRVLTGEAVEDRPHVEIADRYRPLVVDGDRPQCPHGREHNPYRALVPEADAP